MVDLQTELHICKECGREYDPYRSSSYKFDVFCCGMCEFENQIGAIEAQIDAEKEGIDRK